MLLDACCDQSKEVVLKMIISYRENSLTTILLSNSRNQGSDGAYLTWKMHHQFLNIVLSGHKDIHTFHQTLNACDCELMVIVHQSAKLKSGYSKQQNVGFIMP